MAIHPTAVVSPNAEIGKNVEIGPYAVIDDDVRIGDDCFIDAHVKIGQYTTIGPRCRIYFGAFVGAEPQDHRFYKGIQSYTEIGSDTVIREYVTIHRPPFEFLKTTIGNHVLLMAFVHIGHDVIIGDRVTIANNTALSGHVQVGQGAVFSGCVLVHQFCRIGRKAMIGGLSGVDRDVIPFGIVTGDRGKLRGLNVIGLKRSGYDEGVVKSITKAFMFIFKGKEGTFEDRLAQAHEKFKDNEMVMEQVKFIDEALQGRRKIMVAE